MISWSTIQTLLLLFGPLVLPKVISLFRAARLERTPPRDLDSKTKFSLNLLIFALVLALASSLPYFQDENIIKRTGARLLMTSNDVLLHRLDILRLQQGLPKDDIALLHALRTREGRLVYATYGPRALTECSWCKLSDPLSYLCYSIPMIAVPHLVNIATLGIATSSLSSKQARYLRIHATIAGLSVAMGEFILLYNFDIFQNTRSVTSGDVNWFHWRLRTYRGLAIATTNLVFGIAIYLSATGRFGFGGISDLEKMEAVNKSLDAGLAHVRTGLFVKSATVRNEPSLQHALEFWKTETINRQAIASQVEDTRDHILKQMDIDLVNDEAFKFASNLIDAIATVRA